MFGEAVLNNAVQFCSSNLDSLLESDFLVFQNDESVFYWGLGRNLENVVEMILGSHGFAIYHPLVKVVFSFIFPYFFSLFLFFFPFSLVGLLISFSRVSTSAKMNLISYYLIQNSMEQGFYLFFPPSF